MAFYLAGLKVDYLEYGAVDWVGYLVDEKVGCWDDYLVNLTAADLDYELACQRDQELVAHLAGILGC